MSDPRLGNTTEQSTRLAAPGEVWLLRLYVAGQTPKCLAAFARLKKLCDEYLPGQYRIELVDLLVNPRLALEDEIVAIPTVVRSLPPPFRRIIGDLSDSEQTLVGLQLRPEQAASLSQPSPEVPPSGGSEPESGAT